MKMRNEYTCPLEMTHDMIKGKWKPIMQSIGIDMMKEDNRKDFLKDKGLL